jgi:hypothetical protein
MIKNIVQYFSPITASAYYLLDKIIDLPFETEVLGSLAIIAMICGLTLKVNDRQYDGNIVVIEKDAGGKIYSLELDGDPELLDTKDEVIFRIKKD